MKTTEHLNQLENEASVGFLGKTEDGTQTCEGFSKLTEEVELGRPTLKFGHDDNKENIK